MRKSCIVAPFYVIAMSVIVYCVYSSQWAALVSAITAVISVSIIIISIKDKPSPESELVKAKFLLKLFAASMTTTSFCLFVINELFVQLKWLTYFAIAFLFIAVILGWADFIKTANDEFTDRGVKNG